MDQAGMLHHSAACGAGDASFVWHFSGYHDPEQTIAAISCDAQLGANGCGVAQPIESAEEALLPLATRNPGFLRSDPKRGRSLVLIVIITDNDDYSLADRPQLDRYLTDLQAVRPAGWLQVAIIAGLPPDLERDFVDSDEPPNLYYDRVLADPRMLRDGVACEAAAASARAPRRLVQFAKAFGADASVTSICREDWKHALFYHLQEGIRDIVTVCLPRDHGLVNEHSTCRMTWELPFEHDPEQPLTPATCADQPEFLSTPEPEFPRMSERGRTLCEVRRAPFVQDSMSGEVEVDGEGFYAPLGPCSGGTGGIGRVVSFTGRAKPPHGVTVRLSCTESECEDLGQRR